MDDKVIEFLNHFSAGDVVLFILGVGFVLFNIFNAIRLIAKKYEAYIQKKIEEEQSRQDLVTSVEEVHTELTSLKEELDDIQSRCHSQREDVCFDRQHVTTAIQEVNNKVTSLTENMQRLEDRISKIDNQIRILFKTDVEYVKAYLVDGHNRYVREKKPIDLITLQNFEGIYNSYLDEAADGGNEFLEKIMEDLRHLPTKSR